MWLDILVCSHMWVSVADCIQMGLLIYSVWESVADCIHMGLLYYSFWNAPKCESLLQTVSTWAYCFTLLVCSLVWASVMDCIHIPEPQPVPSLLPPRETVKEARDDHTGCVCLWCTCPMRESPLRTVSHGLRVSVMYLSHTWESAPDCTTWTVCVCDVLVPCVRVLRFPQTLAWLYWVVA